MLRHLLGEYRYMLDIDANAIRFQPTQQQASNVTEIFNTPAPKLESATPQTLPNTPDVMSLLNSDNVTNPIFPGNSYDYEAAASTNQPRQTSHNSRQPYVTPVPNVPQNTQLAYSPRNQPQTLANPLPDGAPLGRTPSMTSQQSLDLIEKLQAEQEKKVIVSLLLIHVLITL
jgi:hypothetical protein